MAKKSGLGDNAFVQGRDLSGDLASLQRIGGGPGLIDVTGISSSAIERLGTHKNGEIGFQTFFNDATNQEHDALKGLATTDQIVSYLRGTALGDPVACMLAKQINYDWARGQDGALLGMVQCLSNAEGLEWCEALTAGKVTHASATNGTSRDYGAVSTLFGMSAYWHVFSLASGTVDGEIQDSADNVSFALITGGGFTALTARGAERIETGATATVRRYVRFASTDTFTTAVLFAAFIRHLTSTL